MKLFICVDPGETTGWSLWDYEGKLRYADQTPMWNFADLVYHCLEGKDPEKFQPFMEGLTDEERGTGHLPEISAMIVEQWQLYPWELQNLAWDECRTARLIGALTLLGRIYGVELQFQGADIKKGAQAAGAESLYLEPVHENRHANDSIQHGVFFLATNGGPPA